MLDLSVFLWEYYVWQGYQAMKAHHLLISKNSQSQGGLYEPGHTPEDRPDAEHEGNDT